jgi:acyl-CoA synthetase (AMP-forming)/AMP-acid ligase II
VRRVCGGALALGLRQGDRVAIFAPNCIEYPELLCGLSDAGAIVATVNARSTARELEPPADDCGARLLVVHPSLSAIAAAARVPTLERTLVLGREYEAWLAASAPSLPLESIAETDPFTLVYSSGTTGKPKGIVISHRSRTLTFHGMAMEYGCYGPDDLQLGIAPMAHGAGFAFIMASLYFGGTVEVLPKFDPQRVVEKLAREPFTGVFMVPTHFQAIFGLEAAVLDAHRGRARALRTIMSNAAALPQAVKEKIVAYWGEGLLHETYGSTEAGIVTNLRPADQLRRQQSVGPAFALNAGPPARRRGPRGAARRGRRAAFALAVSLQRLLEQARRDGRLPEGRLGHRGRPRAPGRGRLLLHRRSQEGHGRHRRLQRLPARDRGSAACAPGGARGRGDRPARRLLRRGAARLRGVQEGARGQCRRPRGALPHPARRLQGAEGVRADRNPAAQHGRQGAEDGASPGAQVATSE